MRRVEIEYVQVCKRSLEAVENRRRSPRLRNRALAEVSYCELKDDEDFDLDNGLGQDLQQGYLCASADPRRVGGPGGEPTVIHIEELRTLLRTQQTLDDQSVWLTTAQAGFPVLADAQEVQSASDQLMGSPVARFLHPTISSFIQERWRAIDSSERIPSRTEVLAKCLEETWRWSQPSTMTPNDTLPVTSSRDEVMWEPDPKPLMASHPLRLTDSNTRISLSEAALSGPCPRDNSGRGWVQIQRKSLFFVCDLLPLE